jgi:hypothetical protein
MGRAIRLWSIPIAIGIASSPGPELDLCDASGHTASVTILMNSFNAVPLAAIGDIFQS